MKKVLMPKEQDLYKMADMGLDMYKYLLCKTIESIAVEGKNYPAKGMLENEMIVIKEDPDIAHSLCLLYPDEVVHSTYAKYDMDILVKRVTNGEELYKDIDEEFLLRYDESMFNHPLVQSTLITNLDEKLNKTPRYRFEYSPNKLYEEVFSGKIKINDMFMTEEKYKDLAYKLVRIDPYYLTKFNKEFIPYGLDEANKYFKRYDVTNDDYYGKGKEILLAPDKEVRRLVKRINKSDLY